MAERLSDVELRIGSVRQLSAVITAMRGIAAARSREAARRLAGVCAFTATIEEAIGRALPLLPESAAAGGPAREERGAHHLLIVLAAEQGFVGAFNNHLIDAAVGLAGRRPEAEVLLVGDRGAMAASERGLAFGQVLPMVAHVEEAAGLASRIADFVFERAGEERLAHVTLLHSIPQSDQGAGIVAKTLLPFDYARIPGAAGKAPEPLITLPPEELLESLTEEYVFAALCEALLLSYAAENEARMRAMVVARENVERTLDELTGKARQLRQEQITDELIELTAGTRASEG